MLSGEVREGLGRFVLLLGVYVAGMVVGELNTWTGSIMIGLPIGSLLAFMAVNRDWFGRQSREDRTMMSVEGTPSSVDLPVHGPDDAVTWRESPAGSMFVRRGDFPDLTGRAAKHQGHVPTV